MCVGKRITRETAIDHSQSCKRLEGSDEGCLDGGHGISALWTTLGESLPRGL